MFSEIEIIDGDEFDKMVDQYIEREKRDKTASLIFSGEYSNFLKEMSEKYKDNKEVMDIINNKKKE